MQTPVHIPENTTEDTPPSGVDESAAAYITPEVDDPQTKHDRDMERRRLEHEQRADNGRRKLEGDKHKFAMRLVFTSVFLAAAGATGGVWMDALEVDSTIAASFVDFMKLVVMTAAGFVFGHAVEKLK